MLIRYVYKPVSHLLATLEGRIFFCNTPIFHNMKFNFIFKKCRYNLLK